MFLGIILLILNGKIVKTPVTFTSETAVSCVADAKQILNDNADLVKQYQDTGLQIGYVCADVRKPAILPPVTDKQLQDAKPKTGV